MARPWGEELGDTRYDTPVVSVRKISSSELAWDPHVKKQQQKEQPRSTRGRNQTRTDGCRPGFAQLSSRRKHLRTFLTTLRRLTEAHDEGGKGADGKGEGGGSLRMIAPGICG